MKKLITLLMMAFAVVAISCADEEAAIVNPPSTDTSYKFTAKSGDIVIGGTTKVKVSVASGDEITLTAAAVGGTQAAIFAAIADPTVAAMGFNNIGELTATELTAFKKFLGKVVTTKGNITKVNVTTALTAAQDAVFTFTVTAASGATKVYTGAELNLADYVAAKVITTANFNILKAITVADIATASIVFDKDGAYVSGALTGSVKELTAIKKGFEDSFKAAIAGFTGGAAANIIPANINVAAVVKSPATDLTADGNVVVEVTFNLTASTTIEGSPTLTQDYTYTADVAAVPDGPVVAADYVVTTPASIETAITAAITAVAATYTGGEITGGTTEFTVDVPMALEVANILNTTAADGALVLSPVGTIAAIKAIVESDTAKVGITWNNGIVDGTSKILTLTGTPTKTAGNVAPAGEYTITVTLATGAEEDTWAAI